jgi:phospholipid/cholesterol/gamma-HCH transport system permease protein
VAPGATALPRRSADFAIERDRDAIRLDGTFRMADAASIWRELHRATDGIDRGPFTIDLSGVAAVDGTVMALVVALRNDLSSRGVRTTIEGAPDRIRPLVELYELDAEPTRKKRRRKPEGIVTQVGRSTVAIFREVEAVVAFLGEMLVALVGLVRRPRSVHWKDLPSLVERTGADAIPIIVLINFLVGFVMAYQSSRQLTLYGANLYVADLVGISMTRELAPLMTAIIVCGRSGASFAAEIGSMNVSEEVDALRTLGLRPYAWLVVPRLIALVVVLPMQTLVGDIVGTLGGLVVGATSLNVTPRGYFIETTTAVQPWDVLHGLIKSVVFALAIGLIACQQGFAASGGAEGVGRRTTSTVVTSLFAIVVLDALFTVVFRIFGR